MAKHSGNWWDLPPRGARSTREWMTGLDGRSTPLMLALVNDIEAIELKLYDLAREIPASYPLKSIKRRLDRLEKNEPPLLDNGVPASIVPLELEVGRIISNALIACGGDVEAAAIGLDIGAATIYRKIKKYGFDVEAIRRAARKKEASEGSGPGGPAPEEVQVPVDHGS